MKVKDDAETCKRSLTGRYYGRKIIIPEFSPVTDFRESRCRQYDEGVCSRGGYCNFMHLKHISRSFKKSLFREMYETHPEFRKSRKNFVKEKESDARKRSVSSDKKKKDKGSPKKDISEKEAQRKDMDSEDRRAMIAKWNDADEEEDEVKVKSTENAVQEQIITEEQAEMIKKLMEAANQGQI